MFRRVAILLAALIVVIAGAVPLAITLWDSLFFHGHLGLFYYEKLLFSGGTWELLGNSVLFASCATGLSLVLGVPLGLLFSRTNLPGRGFLLILFALPVAVPPYVIAVSWFYLLTNIMSKAPSWFFGLAGCLMSVTPGMLSLVVLLTAAYTRTVDRRLEEAGRLYSGWFRVARRITLPLAGPGISLAGLLVFLLTMGELGVPMFLRYKVFPVETFSQFSAFYDFKAATAAATPLILVVIITLALERVFIREKTYQAAPDSGFLPTMNLGRWRWITLGLVIVLGFLDIGVPLGELAIRAGLPGAWQEVWARAGDSLIRSVAYGTVGATTMVVLGFLTAYAVHHRLFKHWMGLDSLLLFLFALPGSVIGVGLIATWNHPWTNIIYATSLIVILGYIARYTALPHRITLSALAQLSPSSEEAAMVLGAGWMRRVVSIVAPQIKKGIALAWAGAYVFCLRDLATTIMVYPPGHDTLAVRGMTLMANGSPTLVAGICLLSIAASVIPPAGIISLVWRRK